jgi:hypothetical protein
MYTLDVSSMAKTCRALSLEFGAELGYASDIAAGPAKARNQTYPHRIGCVCENDGNR